MKHKSSVTSVLLKYARHVGPIKCIFDCGSRDALDGLELYKELSASELHCFEPNPQAIKLCKNNIAKVGSAVNAKVIPCAIAEKSGMMTFYSIDAEKTVTPHEDGNIGASSLYKVNPDYPHEKYVTQPIQVESISLDDYCRSNAVPDLLWLDLQGAEAMALKGGKAILSSVKLIQVEIAFRKIYLEQASFADVDGLLKEQFELVDLDVGRWPRIPKIYTALGFGPWVGNAIYVNRKFRV